ncbi:hypothetical protein ACFJGV_10820 [Cnuibacter sp. UC19_7]|uniref:hypothetical protein n=1 Tax=Cnuibacter sp. UC19_7 TaxID=3350166 RepID=UPI0036717BA4
MTKTTSSLADGIETLLRSIPGVQTIYAATPAPALLLNTLLPAQSGPLVHIQDHPDSTAISVNIGISPTPSADITGQEVTRELLHHLTHAHPKPVALTVRICMIENPRPWIQPPSPPRTSHHRAGR